jgi:hypothetical protein
LVDMVDAADLLTWRYRAVNFEGAVFMKKRKKTILKNQYFFNESITMFPVKWTNGLIRHACQTNKKLVSTDSRLF